MTKARKELLDTNKSGETLSQWVSRNGGQALVTTNEFEVARFMADGQTQVIYKGKRGINFSSYEAEKIYWKFVGCEDFQIGAKTKYHKSGSVVLRTLLERDGPHCFYCKIDFDERIKPTIEHLVARAHKGPDHISNKFLACQKCNLKAGHKSAPEKIAMRDAIRSGRIASRQFQPNAVMSFAS